MKLGNPELRSRLASEYVLGTLKGGARRRFEDHLKNDATLRTEVAGWERHLSPLAERLAPVTPSDRVWTRIEARLDRQSPNSPSAVKAVSLWESLTFWRSLGLRASTLAVALLTAMLVLKPVEQSPILTAVLAEDNNVARVFVEQQKSGMLMVKMVTPWKTMNGMSLELWVVPKEGAPRSLGLINDTGETRLALTGMDEKLSGGLVFALSKEPPGGAPTGQPTGSVMCKGAIAHMPSKVPRTPI
ncbi:MAG: anti-sigma factor [Burkholderiales bacterium]|nr:anti-sigma factor [Burkholderiales bacterium]